MDTELIHIGFGNVLAVHRVIAMLSPNSAPTKRMVQHGRSSGMLVDMTNGRRTKAVLIMDSNHIVLAAIAPETIAGRLTASREDQD
ncbi:Extracellular matrix regulatory protein A [subsurface metagenome]